MFSVSDMSWRQVVVLIVLICNCRCDDEGPGRIKPTLRIYNGDQATAGEFPFVVGSKK